MNKSRVTKPNIQHPDGRTKELRASFLRNLSLWAMSFIIMSIPVLFFDEANADDEVVPKTEVTENAAAEATECG